MVVDTVLPGSPGHSTAEPELNLIAFPSYQASHFAQSKCMPSYGCRMQDYALADSSYHIATLLLTLVAGNMGKRIIHGVLLASHNKRTHPSSLALAL